MPWTRLRYHLVFSTHYRRPWLKEEYDEFLYGRLGQITKQFGGYPYAINGWHDHVHILCALPPNTTVSDCVAKLKSQSSGALRNEYPAMRNFRWAIGYGALTFDHRRIRGIANYVRNQKQRHGRQTTRSDWERTR